MNEILNSYENINEEIEQLNNLNINYYKLGFISKNGSSLDKDKYILYDINDLYDLNLINN